MSGQGLEFKTTNIYDRSFAVLTPNIRKRALEKLALYKNDPWHPSLRVKKLEDRRAIWEMRVTRSYRITFRKEGEIVLLRNIGTHYILRRER